MDTQAQHEGIQRMLAASGWAGAVLIALTMASLVVGVYGCLRPDPRRTGTIVGLLVAGMVLGLGIPLVASMIAQYESFKVIESLAAPTPKDLAVAVESSLVAWTLGFVCATLCGALTAFVIGRSRDAAHDEAVAAAVTPA